MIEIREEANDSLLVKLLGISSVSVYFDDMEFGGGTLEPTSVVFKFSEEKYLDREPTDEQRLAARQWVARKTGVDFSKVEEA